MEACWIVGAGEFCAEDFSPRGGDYVIAADGGLKYLESLGARPDMVLGDFDSLGYVPDYPNVVRHNPIKDDPDMMLAVGEGLERGYRRFFLLGGTGGRIAHTLANVQTLIFLARKGCEAFLVGTRDEMASVSRGGLSFVAGASGYLSVFSFDGTARGVSMSGLKYCLENAELESARPLGLSNEFIGAEARVSVEDGALIAVYAKRAENRPSYFRL